MRDLSLSRTSISKSFQKSLGRLAKPMGEPDLEPVGVGIRAGYVSVSGVWMTIRTPSSWLRWSC
jgi:hypothetical protein